MGITKYGDGEDHNVIDPDDAEPDEPAREGGGEDGDEASAVSAE